MPSAVALAFTRNEYAPGFVPSSTISGTNVIVWPTSSWSVSQRLAIANSDTFGGANAAVTGGSGYSALITAREVGRSLGGLQGALGSAFDPDAHAAIAEALSARVDLVDGSTPGLDVTWTLDATVLPGSADTAAGRSRADAGDAHRQRDGL